MARLTPIAIPSGVQVTITGQSVSVKGAKGTLQYKVHTTVQLGQSDNTLTFTPNGQVGADMHAGTTRAIMRNLLEGVHKGYEKKLELVGVGYRAAAQGKKLNLTLGYSHPVNYTVPEGITVETPSQTEIIVKGISKHIVGQVAADIRGFRPPEPYKGKGVKYAGEKIILKEAKKK